GWDIEELRTHWPRRDTEARALWYDTSVLEAQSRDLRMRWIRRLAVAAGLAIGVLLLLPALAPLPAAFIDVAPDGTIRPTMLPIGVGAFDPFVRVCARTSLKAAALVAGGSLILGLALARLTTAWRFWGRAPLSAAVLALMVAPPWTGALGLRVWLGSQLDGTD